MILKPNLILHIGMGKTGTTALQEAFWANRDVLARAGITYPDIGVDAGAHHKITPFKPKVLAGNGWVYLKPENWAPELAKSGAKLILMSSELIAWAEPEVAARFCAALSAHFDLKICLYLRRQDNAIMAGYNQQIKAHNQSNPIASILERLIQNYDYARIIQTWEAAVGTANMIVRPYERQQFPGGDLIADFITGVLKIEVPSDFKPLPKENINPKFSHVALEYKRLINCISEDAAVSGFYTEALLEYSKAHDSGSSAVFSEQGLLTPQDRARILTHFSAENAEIAHRFLGRKTLFVESLAEDAAAAPPVSDADLKAVSDWLKQHHPAKGISLLAAAAAVRGHDRPAIKRAGLTLLRSFGRTLGVIQEEAEQAAGAAVQKSKGSPAYRKIKRAAHIGYVQWRQLAFKVSSGFKLLVAGARTKGNQKPASTQSLPIADAPLAGQGEPVLTAPASIKVSAQRANKRELLVHFGTHKTGSSSIQKTLFVHAEGLTNCAYVHGKLPNSSLMIGSSFQSAAAIIARSPGSESSEIESRRSEARKQLAKALNRASAKSDRMVLSAEVISHLFEPELTDLRDWLAPFAQQISFIGYIRDPVSRAPSSFQEQIKTKYPPGFNFDAHFSRPGTSYRIVERLDALFGRDAVTILPFDKSLFPGGDVVQHFLANAQISGTGFKSESVNESLSHLAVKALFCYRSLRERFDTQSQYASREAFIGSLRALDGPSFAVHGDVEQSLRANCKTWDDWAEKRLGRSLPYADSFKDYGIRSESDLMTFSPEELEKFASYAASYGITSISARSGSDDVAGALHVIRNHFVTVGQSVTKRVWRAATKG